jgi:hypothetical protein
LSSAYLEKGETLIISTLGLEGEKSLRKTNDGFTYFGCKKSIKKNNSNFSSNTMGATMGATGTSLESHDDIKFMKPSVIIL